MSDIPAGTIIKCPDHPFIKKATIICRDKRDGMYLVGWMWGDNDTISSAETRQSVSAYLTNHSGALDARICYEDFIFRTQFDFCRWLYDHMFEIISAPVAATSAGMRCAVPTCGVFNPWAEANVGDKYVCYSCRSSGYHHLLEGT